MQTIECWRLLSVGQDRSSLAARFSSSEEAEKAKPYAGGYRGEVEPETVRIYDTAEEWKPEIDEDAKRSGLSKLDDREKAALGLSR